MFCDLLTEDNKCAYAAALWQITFLINRDVFFCKPYQSYDQTICSPGQGQGTTCS